MMSVPPPGVKGTTMRIGRSGCVALVAARDPAASSTWHAKNSKLQRTRAIVVLLRSRRCILPKAKGGRRSEKLYRRGHKGRKGRKSSAAKVARDAKRINFQ